MAANYWNSTQHQFWQARHVPEPPSSDHLAQRGSGSSNAEADQLGLLPNPAHIRLFFHQQLFKLGCRLTVRQVVLSTANVYVRRFYSRVAVRDTNPYMVLATAFYLACKIEECPHHIRVVIAEARGLWQDLVSQDTAKLGECEFHLISELDAHLIIHHPYKALEEVQNKVEMSQDEFNLAWGIVNDHYATDIPLQHPPHVVASAAAIMAVGAKLGQTGALGILDAENLRMEAATQAKGQNSTDGAAGNGKSVSVLIWLSQSNIDIDTVADCVRQLISLYAAWESYSDKTCKEKFVRLVKEGNVLHLV